MQLYELIQSMTKAEKRYFKLYAQMGSKKGQVPKYIALFDVLNSQQEYDDEMIKKKGFGGDTKAFLNEKLLESLHVFHLRKSPDAELRLLLNQIAILFEKKLWIQMGKRLKKARQLAEENERFLFLLEIIEWEQELGFKNVNTNQREQQRKLIKERNEIKKKYNDENQYEDLAVEAYALKLKDRFKNPNNQKEFEKFCDTPLLNENAHLPSKRAKIQYHHLNHIRCTILNKPEEDVISHLKTIIDTTEKNNFLFYMRDFPAFYIRTLFRYRNLSKNFEQTQSIYEIIERLPFQSIDITYSIGIQSLIEYTKELNKKEGELVINQMEQEWGKYTSVYTVLKLIQFLDYAVIFYSVFEDWNKAQKWLDKIFTLGRSSDRKDIQTFARLWQLAVAYERTPDELDKCIQSTYKFLSRNKHYFDMEKRIIQDFRALYKAVDYKEKKSIWEELHSFLDNVIKNKNTPTHRELEKLKLWCESKIKRTSMADVIRHKQQSAHHKNQT